MLLFCYCCISLSFVSDKLLGAHSFKFKQAQFGIADCQAWSLRRSEAAFNMPSSGAISNQHSFVMTDPPTVAGRADEIDGLSGMEVWVLVLVVLLSVAALVLLAFLTWYCRRGGGDTPEANENRSPCADSQKVDRTETCCDTSGGYAEGTRSSVPLQPHPSFREEVQKLEIHGLREFGQSAQLALHRQTSFRDAQQEQQLALHRQTSFRDAQHEQQLALHRQTSFRDAQHEQQLALHRQTSFWDAQHEQQLALHRQTSFRDAQHEQQLAMHRQPPFRSALQANMWQFSPPLVGTSSTRSCCHSQPSFQGGMPQSEAQQCHALLPFCMSPPQPILQRQSSFRAGQRRLGEKQARSFRVAIQESVESFATPPDAHIHIQRQLFHNGL
uniref:Uncharacterized protein n=1 Tax=Trypanosoma vivax (strain Y486) TaxID=1055687 RepID=G0UAR0_TRYVY|nr:hypothetical protein TVY486_1103790 [Trypanosoma vivax Y486]